MMEIVIKFRISRSLVIRIDLRRPPNMFDYREWIPLPIQQHCACLCVCACVCVCVCVSERERERVPSSKELSHTKGYIDCQAKPFTHLDECLLFSSTFFHRCSSHTMFSARHTKERKVTTEDMFQRRQESVRENVKDWERDRKTEGERKSVCVRERERKKER